MAEDVSSEEVADLMYGMVKDAQGMKKLKAMDLTKAMMGHFGEERCSKKICKSAIRSLIDSGRCVYTYFGGSYVELPPEKDTPSGH